ncbi:hypothetical protein [Cellulophaga baltica]|uniref:hypothetical protein n=3 Tax=Cellulophaga baltica TaxID=76594 RepID=UPI0015F3C7F7|nr:hypothetical protein [Cellulophaga baltica]MBA6313680.1 hypothetical protein [Cellulophaga baltica]
MSSFWKAAPEEKVIRHNIEYHQVKAEKVRPGKRLNIQEANDLFFVTNESVSLTYFWSSIHMALLLLVFFLIILFTQDNVELEVFILPIFPFLIALIFLMIHIMAPVKEIVLDRLNGKITYPKTFIDKEHRTIEFDSLHVYRTLTTSGDFAITGEKIFIKDRKFNYTWTLKTNECLEYWSFMVWYMDKNRPLPPGSAFDPYRENDYLRRKEEGFPKPLYPSGVTTPEAKPAWQRERKKIGGW